eukprot:gb/GFBE01016399.1/.p1 GENE.gb/GFBE01016399.1/~~gb/GFBE01016399.1/.p1  ORF type:complete len:215 (+),score=24.13 gb/GFBE01016399.1/:1-645(+)
MGTQHLAMPALIEEEVLLIAAEQSTDLQGEGRDSPPTARLVHPPDAGTATACRSQDESFEEGNKLCSAASQESRHLPVSLDVALAKLPSSSGFDANRSLLSPAMPKGIGGIVCWTCCTSFLKALLNSLVYQTRVARTRASSRPLASRAVGRRPRQQPLLAGRLLVELPRAEVPPRGLQRQLDEVSRTPAWHRQRGPRQSTSRRFKRPPLSGVGA